MTEHTPGPWKVSRGEPAVIAQDDEVVATCYLFRGSDEDYANARLIAAAPQLLEACKAVLNAGGWYRSALEIDIHDTDKDGKELKQMLKEAIDKAEGEQ